jgi:AcrR family transcriptional regulator
MVKTRTARARTGADRDTEQRIIAAAHTVFVRRGTAGARMQEIADEAAVNKALLHYYFRNKRRLAEAVFQRAIQGLFERAGEVLVSDVSLEAKVKTLIGLYLDQLSKAPFLPGYVLAELNQHPERATQFAANMGSRRAVMLATLDRQLKASIRAGTVRRIPTRQFIVNLVSLCIFPFAARPMLCTVLNLDADGFDRFIEER